MDYNLITIRPIGRSGSIFLQSLFDGHPQILSLPSYFPFYFHWKYFHTLNAGKNSQESLVNYFTGETPLAFLFEGKDDPFYAWVDETGTKRTLKLSKNEFTDNLLKEMKAYPSRKQFLIAIHKAFAKTVGIDSSQKNTILLHEHYPYEFAAAHQDFPNVKQILTVRDPRNVYASTVRYILREKGALFAPLFIIREMDYAIKCYVNATVFEKRNPAGTRFVEIEKFNAEPVSSIQKLAAWAGITDHESLLIPSFAGHRDYTSPDPRSQQHKNTAAQVENRWRHYCSPRELKMMGVLFRDLSQRFGYDLRKNGPSIWQQLSWVLLPDFQVIRYRFAAVGKAAEYFLSLNWIFLRLFFLYHLSSQRRRDYFEAQKGVNSLIRSGWVRRLVGLARAS